MFKKERMGFTGLNIKFYKLKKIENNFYNNIDAANCQFFNNFKIFYLISYSINIGLLIKLF